MKATGPAGIPIAEAHYVPSIFLPQADCCEDMGDETIIPDLGLWEGSVIWSSVAGGRDQAGVRAVPAQGRRV